MTSRVQKGGPIFRPVKSRARPEINQPAPADNPGNVQHVSSPLLPTSLPASSETLSADAAVASASPPNVIPSTTSVPAARIPPNISAPPPVLSRRNTPAPPTLITRVTHIPVNTNSPFMPSLHSTSSVQNSFAGSQQMTSNSLMLPAPGAENIPFSSSNAKLSDNLRSSTTKTTNTASNPVSTLGGEQIVKDSVTKSTGISSSTSRGTPAKRKRKTTDSEVEGTDDDIVKFAATKRKRHGSAAPRSRRSRGPSLPPFDPNADPGEEIDPTVVTMASLCSDTGQGRVSSKAAEILSNHAAWKLQNREKRTRMKALMELKKYGREEEAEALEAAQVSPINKVPEGAATDSSQDRTITSPAIGDDTGNEFDYTQDLTTSRFNVQVRIGPNGETVIDEESLVVDRVEAEDTTNYTHVVESDHTKFVNSGSYGKRYRGSRWSAEETELFFDALSQYGENYELIAYVLPGRDRKSCKNKFKTEDKKNPARINHCLNNNRPVDIATLSRMTGKDFSGPVPEIRVPTPQPLIQPEAFSAETEAAAVELVRKNPKKRKSQLDDGAVVVGDADSFVPFPPSP
ncbi:Transcription factor TFIIIB component B'' [Termitomyces sp. T112]|nr:Transcription factor TFIIIB component B'' [Termitomyces sp. T112]